MGSASQTRNSTLQNSPKTELSPPPSSIGGAEHAQDDQASERGMYEDCTKSVEYETLREAKEAEALGYFDHGIDAWQ
jgi:hypothetical protein